MARLAGDGASSEGYAVSKPTLMKDRRTITIRIEPRLHERLLRYVKKEPGQVGKHKQNEPDRRSIQSVAETAIKEYLLKHRA